MTNSTGGNFNIRLYDMFRQRFNFGESDAREMAIEMKEVIKEENTVMQDQTLNIVLKEFENVRKEFENVRKEFEKVHKEFEFIRKDINAFKDRVDDRFTYLEKSMATKADVAESKAEILRWSFIFWIGQATVLGGILLLIFKNIK